jgi:hypothetical protein
MLVGAAKSVEDTGRKRGGVGGGGGMVEKEGGREVSEAPIIGWCNVTDLDNGQRLKAIQTISHLPAGFGLGASEYSALSGSVCAVELYESLLRLFRDL